MAAADQKTPPSVSLLPAEWYVAPFAAASDDDDEMAQEWLETQPVLAGLDLTLARAVFQLEAGHLTHKLRHAPTFPEEFPTNHHPDWLFFLLRKAAADETDVSKDELNLHFNELDEFRPPRPSDLSLKKQPEDAARILKGVWTLRSMDAKIPGSNGATGRIAYADDVMCVCVRFGDTRELMSSYAGPYDLARNDDDDEAARDAFRCTHYARAGFTSARVRAINPNAGVPGGSFQPRHRLLTVETVERDTSRFARLTISVVGHPSKTLVWDKPLVVVPGVLLPGSSSSSSS